MWHNDVDLLTYFKTRVNKQDMLTHDFMAFKFEWKGLYYYIVIKSRFAINYGLQHGVHVDRVLDTFKMRAIEDGTKTPRILIIDTDTIELRLNKILPNDFFKGEDANATLEEL